MAKTPNYNYLSAGKRKGNYLRQENELKRVKAYLAKHNATGTMVSDALNIRRPNMTRYKTTLEREGLLKVTHRSACKATLHQADYLTCDPAIIKILTESTNAAPSQSRTIPTDGPPDLFSLNK